MADTAPRRGRPPAVIDPAKLPEVARILRPHLTPAVREASGLSAATLSEFANGRLANPGFATLRAILRAVRPGDKDEGWGWFGRQLAAAT